MRESRSNNVLSFVHNQSPLHYKIVLVSTLSSPGGEERDEREGKEKDKRKSKRGREEDGRKVRKVEREEGGGMRDVKRRGQARGAEMRGGRRGKESE